MRERVLLQHLRDTIHELLPLPGAQFHFAEPRAGGLVVVEVGFRGLAFSLVMELHLGYGKANLERRWSRLKQAIQDMPQAVHLLVAPYFSPAQQQGCRREGIFFLDVSGNAFLHYENLYVERLGLPNRFPVRRHGRSPFSDKASLILRVLMQSDRKLWGIREIAEQVGLDPGFVSRIAKELEERRYASRRQGKLTLRSWEEALDDWSSFYSYRKNASQGYFCLAGDVQAILDRLRACKLPNQAYALSVQVGANLVAPHSQYREVHLYAPDADSRAMIEQQMELEPVEEGANVVIMDPYYRHSVFYGSNVVQELNVVSPVQLYLDVVHYPQRGQEQADYLKRQRIQPVLGAPHESEPIL